MSTLAAARADNFYFPPDYDINGGSLKHQRKMKYQKDRKPSRLDQYKIKSGPKIRFETPFHVRCLNCNHMIAKGVRFNAVKKEIGQFHSTTILQFSMLCPACKNTIVCKTDPENCDYVYTEGAQRWLNTEKATDMEFLPDPEEKKKKESNPMYKLESKANDLQKQGDEQIEALLHQRQESWKNDFDMNLLMRKKLKAERKNEIEQPKVMNFALPLEQLSKSELSRIKFKNNPKTALLEKRRTILSKSILPCGSLSQQQQDEIDIIRKKVSQIKGVKHVENSNQKYKIQIQKL